MRIGKRVVVMAAVAAVLVVGLTNGKQLAATSALDWLAPPPTVTYFAEGEQTPDMTENQMPNPCIKQTITYYNPYAYGVNKVESKEACVHIAQNFRLVRNFIQACTWWGCTNYDTEYISLPGDTMFHRVSNLTGGGWDGCWQTSPDTNGIYFICGRLHMVKDLLAYITPSTNGDEHYYEFDAIAGYTYVENETTRTSYTAGATISPNGKWGVLALSSVGLIRINLLDGTLRLFTKDIPSFGYGSDPSYDFSITDDGRYIAAGGNNVGAKVYAVDDTCGEVSVKIKETWYDRYTPINACPNQDLVPIILESSGNPAAGIRSLSYVKFSGDGGQITAFYYPWQGAPGAIHAGWLTITAAGYVKPRAQIDYLALGDSFSSGEGDTERRPNSNLKYYREHTDDDGITVIGSEPIHDRPTEKCHLSTRSYPYILANGMDLGDPTTTPNTPWQSVACSGATAWDVKEHAFGNYLGQGDRLKGYDYEALKAQALNEFIPGRQKQIEFVKKYQPKVITLTMGGNDVDFAGKLFECTTKPWQCNYASISWRDKLRKEMEYQFKNLSDLYAEISNATDSKAKIYVLGYPIFINGNPYAKCSSIFWLDNSEREMINNSIIYLNNIIEQAAKKAGVKYINVENAFGNHRLCDAGSQHVTAVTNVFGASGNEQQEDFHPNHFGHVDLANAVWSAVGGQSLLDYQTCSDPSVKVCPNASVAAADAIVPPYFTEGVPADNTEIHYYTLTNGTLVKMTEAYDVHTQTMVFKSESKVDITLYSDPTSLGQATAASDGSVSTQITIPSSVPVGYHTLVLRGQSPDGTPVELYQTVEVRGSNPNDIDEDGIDDSVDKCTYITPLNIDTDHDGIDDACDPEVNVSEAPYRIRLGDPTRSYANQPEKSNYLYLERNVNATALTGISGDADPDGDGWAVVGASSGKAYSTTTPTSIPDTAPYANFTMTNYDPAATIAPTSPIVPSIYLRAGDFGCVEYKPTSLSKVLPGEVRTLTLTARGLTGSANHCRPEPATADADHDGQPDNTQPLYLARNGDSTKGEDPTRTYLFRNFYAAEAQLGITDYTPTGTPANTPDKATQPLQPWNLLATSKDVGYSPVFNKLTITTDSTGKPWPIILARKHNTTNPSSAICIAYQPDSQTNTTNIKLATQPTRQLQLMKWKDVPEGVGCE
ncbi:SGNH/GDSL hydrolase family protein [Candidatus Saccharibacteria bacterium]|nr:MAG: SGNH/GDSL hydrolase family protein [Candidatus Saccharibacteria bacterium]